MEHQPGQMQPQPTPLQPQASIQPSSSPQPEPAPKPRPLAKLGLAIGVAFLALAIGAGVYLNSPGGVTDQPTQAQITEMESSWAAALQNKITLPVVKPEERAEALASLHLPEKQAETLLAEVESEQVSLVWVTLWDNLVEDGDFVALSSDGVNLTVPLLKNQTRMALPRPVGGVINITGIKDGGGGITLGLMSGPDPVLIPPMAPDQVLGIPVR